MPENFIPLSEPVIGANEKKWLNKCIQSGFVSSAGELIPQFEEQFAALVNAKYAIATASGTAALHVTLDALGIGKEDRVIVPDLTFIASVNPVYYMSAEPVFVDVSPKSWCIDEELLEIVCAKLQNSKKKLRALIPVHLYGSVCNMNKINTIAHNYGLKVIEDSTEALGTTFMGKYAGTLGDAGCYSFNGNKLITTGSGGMVVTDSSRLAKKIRYLINQSKSKRYGYWHEQMGYNYRMTNLSSALGLAQMERIPEIISKKQKIALRYSNAFKNISDIKCHPTINNAVNSYWLYSITLKNKKQRDGLLKYLLDNGIQARKFFSPMHRQPYIKSKLWVKDKNVCKQVSGGVSDLLARTGINLPSSATLTVRDQSRVISCICDYLSV
jgi:perosamine synthetase